MNLVIRHIEHLAITHNCVILPAIGAVLAHEMPARFDASSCRMLPPRRVFTFNPALDHNDGTLVASIARAEGMSYTQATQLVEKETQAMRLALEADSRLSLGRVGTLMRDADGSLRFVAAPAVELSPSCMWLPEIDLSQFALREDSESIPAASVRSRRRPRNIVARTARVAAAVVFLLAVGTAILRPHKLENPQSASLGVELPSVSRSEIIEMPAEAKAPVILVLRHEADAVTQVDTAALAVRRAAAVRRPAAASRYCLVVASLENELEARRFVDKNNDTTLGILVKDGRYRVYAVEGSSIADVNEKAGALNLSARFPSSWVCRK